MERRIPGNKRKAVPASTIVVPDVSDSKDSVSIRDVIQYPTFCPIQVVTIRV